MASVGVDRNALAALTATAGADPTIRAAVAVLADGIATAALELVHGGGKDSPAATPDLQQLLDDHWRPFAVEACKQLQAVGFVVFCLEGRDGMAPEFVVPRVVPVNACSLRVGSVRGGDGAPPRPALLAHCRKSGVPLHTFADEMPDELGAPRSAATAALPHFLFAQQQMHCRRVANCYNSRPQLFVQTRSDPKGIADTYEDALFAEAVSGDAFGATDADGVPVDRRGDVTYRRDLQERSAGRDAQAAAETEHVALQAQARALGRPADVPPVWRNNMFTLPATQELARPTPPASVLGDAREELAVYTARVAQAFGVPTSMLSGGVGAAGSAGGEGSDARDFALLNRTLAALSCKIGDLLSQAFAAAFGTALETGVLKERAAVEDGGGGGAGDPFTGPLAALDAQVFALDTTQVKSRPAKRQRLLRPAERYVAPLRVAVRPRPQMPFAAAVRMLDMQFKCPDSVVDVLLQMFNLSR